MITEYRDARLLEEVDSLDTSDSLMMYAQIGGQALQYLWENGLVHNDIRSGTILIEHSNHTLSARLTGFSNMQALQDTTEKDMTTDIRAIASVVRHIQMAKQSSTAASSGTLCAEESNCAKRKHAAIEDESLESERPRAYDTALYSPSLERSISLALGPHETCPTPHDIRNVFRHAIGCDRARWPPFDSIVFDRTYTFNCFKQNGKSFVQLDQFIEVVYEQSQVTFLVPSLVRHCRRDLIRGTKYLPFDTTSKLLHRNGLFEVRNALLEEAAKRNSDYDANFVIKFVVPVHITCHWPSSMINLTQLSRIAGSRARKVLRDALEPEGLQEIHGHREWKGLYSHSAFVESVLQKSNKELYDQMRNLRLSNDYPYFDLNLHHIRYAEYGIVAFPRLQPHLVLVRRKGFQVNTSTIRGEAHFYDTDDANFTSCNVAVHACQELDLKDLALCLSKMEDTVRTLDWKARIYLNREAMPIADSASDTTSLVTSRSLVRAKESYVEAPEAFRFEKRARLREAKAIQARNPRSLEECRRVTFQVPALSTECISPTASEDTPEWKANVISWLQFSSQ